MNSPKSLNNLANFVSGVQLDSKLVALLNDPKASKELRNEIIRANFENAKPGSALNPAPDLKKLLLNSPTAAYTPLLEEDKVFVRGSAFKTQLPKLYDYTCCISGLRFFASNAQLLDACHIIPFSQTQDDTASNGIILEPTLHRAYDRGLVGIDENFKIHISPILKDSNQRTTRIAEREGATIKLPTDKEFHPDPAKLKTKFKSVFKR